MDRTRNPDVVNVALVAAAAVIAVGLEVSTCMTRAPDAIRAGACSEERPRDGRSVDATKRPSRHTTGEASGVGPACP